MSYLHGTDVLGAKTAGDGDVYRRAPPDVFTDVLSAARNGQQMASYKLAFRDWPDELSWRAGLAEQFAMIAALAKEGLAEHRRSPRMSRGAQAESKSAERVARLRVLGDQIVGEVLGHNAGEE